MGDVVSESPRSHHQSRFGQFLRRYSFEIVWAIVIALGMFLVLERMSIRATLMRWTQQGMAILFDSVGRVANALMAFVARTTLSDALGLVLLAGALMAILLRVRWRLLRTPALTVIKCPHCGSVIHRVHRHGGDRLVRWFVPVRRYRCANRKCRWSGLRIVTGEHGVTAGTVAFHSPSPPGGARAG
jgi:hypothetical protein